MLHSDGDAPRSRRIGSLLISAIPFHEPSGAKITQLLSEREQNLLARIAVTVRFRTGELIYSAGDPARFVYAISAGAVRAYRVLPDGKRAVVAFLFPGDFFGLAENGTYLNSAQAVTPLTAHRLPVSGLTNLLRREPDLKWQILLKMCHEVREAQRHMIVLYHRGALAKLALFLQMLDRWREGGEDDGRGEIYLPMTRSDIADYIGLSLAAVSRSFRTLAARHLIVFRDRRHLAIVDRPGLASLIAQQARG